MRPRLALALLAVLAFQGVGAQEGFDGDPAGNVNLQNLLAALTRGTQVVLYTPLANGLIEVTRFQPPIALPRPQAEAAVAIARQHLRSLDIEHPTAEQFAKALAGGSIAGRDGPMQLPGVLPLTGQPPVVTTEVLLANGLPQVAPPSAAAGGTSSIRSSP